MAHKVTKPKLSKLDAQKKKSENYAKLDREMKELFGQRTRENQLLEKEVQFDIFVKNVRETMTALRHGHIITRSGKTGYNIQYSTVEEAEKQLFDDQNEYERSLATVKLQRKLAVEAQAELLKKIGKLCIELSNDEDFNRVD